MLMELVASNWTVQSVAIVVVGLVIVVAMLLHNNANALKQQMAIKEARQEVTERFRIAAESARKNAVTVKDNGED